MITLHITIASAIFSVMFAHRNYWQIQELNLKRFPINFKLEEFNNAKAKWHSWQFALQIYIGGVIAFASFMNNYSLLNSFGHGLLFGSVFWLVFDTLLGYKLTKNIFHVDSNGIGTIYKNIAWYFTTVYQIKLAGYLLFVSKILAFGIALLLSLVG